MIRVLWALAVVVVLVSLVTGAVSIVGQVVDNSRRAQAEELRDSVREARAQLNACLDELDTKDRRFQSHQRVTAFLRERVDELEALDERGVPQERYDEYLDVFDRYNEAVPEWERLGDSLQVISSTCRAVAEEHNTRVATLVDFLEEEGLWDPDWSPVRPEPELECPTPAESPEVSGGCGDPDVLPEEEGVQEEAVGAEPVPPEIGVVQEEHHGT